MGAKVRCSGCGLEHEPKADALCPACGLPVTVDIQGGGPWTAKPARAALDEADARFAALMRKRSSGPRWLGKGAGPVVILGLLLVLFLLRRLLERYLAGP